MNTPARSAEKDVPALPVIREEHAAGEPWGYGWVRVTHTVLRAGRVPCPASPGTEANRDQ